MNLQNRNRVTDVENKPTVTKGGRGGGAETGLAHALLRGAQSLGRVRLCGPIGLPASSSPASSSVHGIFQARALEWSAIASPGDLLDPGMETTTPGSPALAGGFLTTEPPGKPTYIHYYIN